jgi:hypothetical protein
MSDQWYEHHDHMVTLMQFMADSGEYSKDDMAYATEKPWKFEGVFYQAQAAADLEAANTPETAKLMLNATYGKHKLAEETEQARKIREETNELYQTDLTREERQQAQRDFKAAREAEAVPADHEPDEGDDVVSVDVSDLGSVRKYDARTAYPSALTERLVDRMRGMRVRKAGEPPVTDAQLGELRAGMREAVVREREAQADE